MIKLKIYGAGSIGNHLANAARSKDWEVTICDVDQAALDRTRNDIYPARYGAWDSGIKLCLNDQAPRGGYDLIFIGTPPDSHMSLALDAISEKPRAVLVEKPFATPDLAGCSELWSLASEAGVKLFVGYDHVVSKSSNDVSERLKKNSDQLKTLTVSFREHWQGIFNAHPWLSGPSDTYLGFWKRGGGALGEHSHAVNLWQHFAHTAGKGRVTEVTATLEYITEGGAEYDSIAVLGLKTEGGLVGTVVQDVVTLPVQKKAEIQLTESSIEWRCQPSPYADFVTVKSTQGDNVTEYTKRRPDDFIQELDHLELVLDQNIPSPISGERGLDTMLVIAAGHMSACTGRKVLIDYSKGYTEAALTAV